MLYYLATVTIYGHPRDPRFSAQVRMTSDTVSIVTPPVWTLVTPLEPPMSSSPGMWLAEALEQLQEQL